MRDAGIDADGRRYIIAARILPVITSDLCDVRFYSCPIADVQTGDAGRLIALYRRSQMTGIGDILADATPGAIAGVQAVESELGIYRKWKREDK